VDTIQAGTNQVGTIINELWQLSDSPQKDPFNSHGQYTVTVKLSSLRTRMNILVVYGKCSTGEASASGRTTLT